MKYLKLKSIVILSLIASVLFCLSNVLIASTECIICRTSDGWKIDFKCDGSASLIRGALPIDQAFVAPGTFDIQAIEKEILTLNLDKNSGGKKLAVWFFREGQTSSTASYSDDLVICQELARKVLLEAFFLDIKRFREIVAEFPPFEMHDIVIIEKYPRNVLPVISNEEKVEGEFKKDKNTESQTVSPSVSSSDSPSAKGYPLNGSPISQNDRSILLIKPYYYVLLLGILTLVVSYVIYKKRK
jgi:hypothetical protein